VTTARETVARAKGGMIRGRRVREKEKKNKKNLYMFTPLAKKLS
jgi:hypothetical protein